MISDPESCHRAYRSRDARFDGRFFLGVVTTGIYCRPICPAPTPKRENVRFFPCSAAAEAAGFRPCRRCRPETSPGSPSWAGTSTTVHRALRMIASGVVDGAGVDALADRLGVGGRHLRRLFEQHLGVSPLAIARTRRIHFARRLIDETHLSTTAIALSAGFQSVRQFHDAIRGTFGRSPRELRNGSPRASSGNAAIELRLAYRPPLDWQALLAFLGSRAIPGVEQVADGAYRRTVQVGGTAGWIEVALASRDALTMRAHLSDSTGLLTVVERVRRIFDLDADVATIAAHLRRDPRLAGSLRPGLRVPGAWDAFELAVRAILGQQVSVAAARTLAGRLAASFGSPAAAGSPPALARVFPSADVLAEAELDRIGLTRARAQSIRALSRAVSDGSLRLDSGASLDEAVERLRRIPGIGEWTAQYVAMRALGEPDAFPVGDLGLRRALGNGRGSVTAAELARAAEEWRPWRAYAAIALWSTLA